MAKVSINTTIEGHIDKYEAFRALCEEVGLKMCADGTDNSYIVEDSILYKLTDESYHGSPKIVREVYSKDFKKAILFENLVNIKHFL